MLVSKYAKKNIRKCNSNEFNSLFEDKRLENNEISRKHDSSGKFSFCLFRRFIGFENDQILREFFVHIIIYLLIHTNAKSKNSINKNKLFFLG